MDELSKKKCTACEGNITALNQQECESLLTQLNDWDIDSHHSSIEKKFQFKGFFRTMSFVNAVAWIANQEGHHPEINISYNQCHVRFTTHAISGLSENDFICAAKVDALL